MRAYSQDLRDRVIELYKTNKYPKRELTKIFKLSYQTVFNWIKRYIESGDYGSKQHIQIGRKPKFIDRNSILEFLANNPDSQGIDIRDSVVPGIPMSTFYGTLSRMGITYKKKNQNIRGEVKKQEQNL